MSKDTTGLRSIIGGLFTKAGRVQVAFLAAAGLLGSSSGHGQPLIAPVFQGTWPGFPRGDAQLGRVGRKPFMGWEDTMP